MFIYKELLFLLKPAAPAGDSASSWFFVSLNKMLVKVKIFSLLNPLPYGMLIMELKGK